MYNRYQGYRYITILVFAVLCLPLTGRAQFGGLGGGASSPVSVGLQYDYFDPTTLNQVVGEFSMTQYSDFLPSGSPFISSTSIGLAGGVRFGPDADPDFRWRFRLFDSDFLVRRIFAMGISVLTADKMARLEEDNLFAEARFGVGPTVGNRTIAISPRIVATAGAGTMVLGNKNYSELAIADTVNILIRLSGFQFGVRAGAAIRLQRRLILLAEYSDRTLFDGLEPRFQTRSAELRIVLGDRERAFRIYARYEDEDAKLNKIIRKQNNKNIKVGIVYSFVRRTKRKWF